ncbi:hypothetical protein V2J09_013063 [Rumex salicifolius]
MEHLIMHLPYEAMLAGPYNTCGCIQNYSEPQDLYKRRKATINEDNVTFETYMQISIFNHPGCASENVRSTEMIDFQVAHTYTLLIVERLILTNSNYIEVVYAYFDMHAYFYLIDLNF